MKSLCTRNGGAYSSIDEKLLRQLRFIRQGSFRETGGPPTLRLIGDVRMIDGVKVEKAVPTGIHYDDLVTAFLANRSIDAEEAKTYLIECAHQNTPYSPVLYFLSQTRLTHEKAFELLDQEQTAMRHTVNAIKKRVVGAMRVSAFGKVDANIDISKILSANQLLNVIKKSIDADKRSLIYQVLRKRPRLVRDVSLEIPAQKLFEAISNQSKSEILKGRNDILGTLLDIFVNKFGTLKGTERTSFRKAVAYIEEQLYG